MTRRKWDCCTSGTWKKLGKRKENVQMATENDLDYVNVPMIIMKDERLVAVRSN